MLRKTSPNNFFATLLLFCLFIPTRIFSQTEYNMTIENVNMVTDRIIEFEVYITSSNEIFALTSYQCTFLFNPRIINGGQLIFHYIQGTSQLSNLPNMVVGVNSLDGVPKLTFASGVGSDYVSDHKLFIGRFRLINTTPFAIVDLNISWNFEGAVSTILTGDTFQNITLPINFYYISNTSLDKKLPKILIPGDYDLLQNYPNPFNPATKITFNLPKEANVELRVYDLLGQEVNALVNQVMDAGIHSVEFAGESLPSGMYLCKLKAGEKFVKIIKMILLR